MFENSLETIECFEAKPAMVKYRDLAQHKEQSKSSFFGEAGLKVLTVYGLTVELPEVVKVMFYDDHTDDQECEGIVIPINDVVEIKWLTEENLLTPEPEDIN